MDIVGYSKLSIVNQRDLIEELTNTVSASESFQFALSNHAVIALATGDGMAIVFLNEPDTPARCAIEIQHLLNKSGEQPEQRTGLSLRMGMHGGMVFRINDINGRENVAGAGINIAQRIMDLGDEGHLLCSTKLADDLQHYSDLPITLTPLGEFSVKHGVAVSVVNVTGPQIGNDRLPVVFAKQLYGSLTDSERIVFDQLLRDSHQTELQLKQAVRKNHDVAGALEKLRDMGLIRNWMTSGTPKTLCLSDRGEHVAACNGLRAATEFREFIGADSRLDWH